MTAVFFVATENQIEFRCDPDVVSSFTYRIFSRGPEMREVNGIDHVPSPSFKAIQSAREKSALATEYNVFDWLAYYAETEMRTFKPQTQCSGPVSTLPISAARIAEASSPTSFPTLSPTVVALETREYRLNVKVENCDDFPKKLKDQMDTALTILKVIITDHSYFTLLRVQEAKCGAAVSRRLLMGTDSTPSSVIVIDYVVTADATRLQSVEKLVSSLENENMAGLTVGTLSRPTPAPTPGPDTIVITPQPTDVASQKGARWPFGPWTTFQFFVCGGVIFVCICVVCIVIMVCCCFQSKNKGGNHLDQKAVSELIAADIESYRKELGRQIEVMEEAIAEEVNQKLSEVEKGVSELGQTVAKNKAPMMEARRVRNKKIDELLSATQGTGRSGRKGSGGKRRSHHGERRSGGHSGERRHDGGHSGGGAPRFEGADPSWAMRFYNDGVR